MAFLLASPGLTTLPYHFAAFAALLGFALLAFAYRQLPTARWNSEWLFLALAGCTVLVWRWPALFWTYPFNIDEGAFVACALKATRDLAPWRGFDAGSSGPLNPDVLALPALFGADITFFSTRLIGICLLIAAIYALYYIAKWTEGDDVARLAIVPPVTFFAFTRARDFLQYSSEQLPIFLTTIALAATVYLATRARTKRSRLIACAVSGLALGSVGFAKLQALPVALAILVFLVAVIVIRGRSTSRADTWAQLGTLVVMLGLVPGLIALSLWKTGEWQYAIEFYLGSAATYVAGGERIGPGFLFASVASYTIFLVCALVVIVVIAIALRGRSISAARSSISVVWAFGFLVVYLFVIYLPGRAFPHYLLLSILPFSYCVASVLGLALKAGFGKGRQLLVAGGIVAWFVIPPLGFALASPNQYFLYFFSEPPLPVDDRVVAIAHYAPPGERVAIWGWMPHFHVLTQTIMATRDHQTGGPMLPGPGQARARERYLSALRASPPPVFVDAVAPGSFGYKDRATQGYQTFPELAAFINENYVLKEDVEGIRIFVAKKR
ncbi:MAG: hypothetical protein QOH88_2186 [Verrucomicrobiota bacterium]|jgi:hypothetical protein